MEPSNPDLHGTTYSGWNLEITVDIRELQRHEAIRRNVDGRSVVVRPAVDPFKFEAWVRENKIVAKVPLLGWADRGNDDWALRDKYGDKASHKHYMDGHDEFRKAFIEDYGESKYQAAFKHVHFHFTSSKGGTSHFVKLSAGDLALNKGKEENKLKLHITSYDLEGETWEDTRDIVNDDGMTQNDVDVTCVEFFSFKRINFYVADLAVKVKRQGEDRFKTDAVDDELAAALAADANLEGRRKRAKPRNTQQGS